MIVVFWLLSPNMDFWNNKNVNMDMNIIPSSSTDGLPVFQRHMQLVSGNVTNYLSNYIVS
jgi:hypothetical protein